MFYYLYLSLGQAVIYFYLKNDISYDNVIATHQGYPLSRTVLFEADLNRKKICIKYYSILKRELYTNGRIIPPPVNKRRFWNFENKVNHPGGGHKV